MNKTQIKGFITSLEEAWKDYQISKSVHKSCKLMGVSGETLRRYFNKAGYRLNHAKWTEAECAQLRQHIANRLGTEAICNLMRRSYASISCKANELGIADGFNKKHKLPETIEKMRKSQKERLSNPDNHPKGMLGKLHSEETKQSIGKFHKGKLVPIEQTQRQLQTKLQRYGTLAPTWTQLNRSWKSGWRTIGGVKIYARSRWEANYGRYLEWLKINGQILKWEHEPETFWFNVIKRGCRSYLPDYRVTNTDNSIEYHEVKGWMDDRSKTKLKRMKKYHPSVILRLIDSKWFKENARKLKGLIQDWE